MSAASHMGAAFSLQQARAGDRVRMVSLDNGDSHHRVAELGLVAGTTVKVRRGSRGGALVVEVRGSMLAMDPSLAAGIDVVRI